MGNELTTWMHRATLYELLSLGFLLPSQQLAEALTSGEFAEAADEVLKSLNTSESLRESATSLLDSYRGRDTDEVYHEILRDSTRLFVGEREPLITPYAGVQAAKERGQQGLLFVGKESMAIERFMKARGVAKDLQAGQSNDPLDHIGTVCEFLKYLCLVNAQAVVPVEGATIAADDFEMFWRDLWGTYPMWCAETLSEQANSDFYRGMAAMLKAACEDYQSLVQE